MFQQYHHREIFPLKLMNASDHVIQTYWSYRIVGHSAAKEAVLSGYTFLKHNKTTNAYIGAACIKRKRASNDIGRCWQGQAAEVCSLVWVYLSHGGVELRHQRHQLFGEQGVRNELADLRSPSKGEILERLCDWFGLGLNPSPSNPHEQTE